MEYAKAILIKLVFTTVVLWFILGLFYRFSFGQVLFLSIVLTAVSFVLGDLIILPRFENWGAVIADFLLVFAAVWVYGTYFHTMDLSVISAAGISALVIGLCEVFFHRYVDSHILHVDDRTGGVGTMDMDDRLQTEFSEEMDPIDAVEEDDRDQ